MKMLAWARVATVVALIGFLLPWAMVSCSGQKLVTLSGVQLASGVYGIRNPVTGVVESQHASPDLWIVGALVAVGLGLIVGFMVSTSEARQTTLWSALAGLVLSAVGMAAVFSGRQAGIARAQAQGQFDAAMNGLIQIHVQFGFWLTLIGLGAAAIACMTEETTAAEANPSPPTEPLPAAGPTSTLMACATCGTAFGTGHRFCTVCGAQRRETSA